MAEPVANLVRKLSLVPTAATQTESTVLPVSIDAAWDKVRNFRFD